MREPVDLLVDLDVPGRLVARVGFSPGAVTGILGPNGAGKSTLLQAVAGLLPGSGSISLGNAEWSAPGRPELLARERRVGLVFQDQALFAHLSALENVAFGLRARGEAAHSARDQARVWLERMGLADLAGRRPRELSGGQAQRVAIARALVTDPAVLLLDEPFAGLDAGAASHLRAELALWLSEYTGVCLLVTHDALDAVVLADQLVVLDQGRVAQVGPPTEVTARPQTEHVARLAGLNVLRRGVELMAFRPCDVTVSIAEPEGSARNRWSGAVTSVMTYGESVRVRVDTREGADLVADLTPSAVAELGVGTGREVWLSVKATATTTYPAA